MKGKTGSWIEALEWLVVIVIVLAAILGVSLVMGAEAKGIARWMTERTLK